jgi:hypothetical protein
LGGVWVGGLGWVKIPVFPLFFPPFLLHAKILKQLPNAPEEAGLVTRHILLAGHIFKLYNPSGGELVGGKLPAGLILEEGETIL